MKEKIKYYLSKIKQIITINGKISIFRAIMFCSAFTMVVSAIFLFILVLILSATVPNEKTLKNYQPPILTRLYSEDGTLLKEYAKEKRLFTSIDKIPDIVKNAFIAAEDSTFYSNSGINIKAIISASLSNFISKISGSSQLRGGSTITQQVAKNFFLTREKTIIRKLKEAILALRMNNSFSKDKILELYLNQIYLGNRSYGVTSASLNYFNKSLDELSLEEVAMIASLPKAPSKLDPVANSNHKELLERRNWILGRMQMLGYITKQQYDEAIKQGIVLIKRNPNTISDGEFFSEEVRKELVNLYGEEKLMNAGNVVITTLDPRLQKLADKYLKQGIEEYDKRHGFRGPIGNLIENNEGIDFEKQWPDLIANYEIKQKYRKEWNRAVVLDIDEEKNVIIIGLEPIDFDDTNNEGLENNKFIYSHNDKLAIMGYIPIKNANWGIYQNENYASSNVKNVSKLNLKIGDVIVVEKSNIENEYFLRQIPAVNGALLAMNPHTGRVLAIMGGYIDSQSDFNRATQAKRQTGSVAKPFAYLSALENGWTPASMIMDEEIELDQGLDRPHYIPKNNENKFYGPTTLRVGLEKSRNVTTVRLTYDVGLRKIVRTIKKFGITDSPKYIYSIALGSMESNLLRIVRAYSMIVNGGKEIQPSFIEKIENKEGKIIYKRNNNKCIDCMVDNKMSFEDIKIPILLDDRKNITDSATAYQVTSLLEGVVQNGTGRRAKAIGKIIGGKTGTTNDANDAWFIGFNPDLVVGVYVGFDSPITLGSTESGASVAAPIFVNFMREALRGVPSIPFRVPNTVNLIRIDKRTGYYPTPYSDPNDIVMEAFKKNDKIVKFTQEITEDNIDEYIEQQSSSRRPEIIMNVEENKVENEKIRKDFEDKNYDVEIIDNIDNNDLDNDLNESKTKNEFKNNYNKAKKFKLKK